MPMQPQSTRHACTLSQLGLAAGAVLCLMAPVARGFGVVPMVGERKIEPTSLHKNALPLLYAASRPPSPPKQGPQRTADRAPHHWPCRVGNWQHQLHRLDCCQPVPVVAWLDPESPRGELCRLRGHRGVEGLVWRHLPLIFVSTRSPDTQKNAPPSSFAHMCFRLANHSAANRGRLRCKPHVTASHANHHQLVSDSYIYVTQVET